MNTHRYDDILHYPRHRSVRRSPMCLQDRAAQFAPFAALTGYDGVLAETGRPTQEQITLDEGGKDLLDEKLRQLTLLLPRDPQVTFLYFRPDGRKAGGAYETVRGHVKKIDPVTRSLVLREGPILQAEQIYAMEWEDLPFADRDDMIEETFKISWEDSYELPQG